MFATLLVWNVLLTAMLAAVVALAGRVGPLRDRPALRHCLWLLVLGKLITPPLVPLPVLSAESVPTSTVMAAVVPATDGNGTDYANLTEAAPPPVAVDTAAPFTVAKEFIPSAASPIAQPKSELVTVWEAQAVTFALIEWVLPLSLVSLTVTLAMAVRVVVQLRRFSRLLGRNDGEGAKRISEIVQVESKRLGLAQTPRVCVVRSVITPLLWVKRSGPVVVLPAELLTRLSDDQIACVVRHEMAHYSRRDHWSNALACSVSCLFWWNPVVWWARRELSQAQEACCDAMVIDRVPGIRRVYAETLLKVIDFVGDRRETPQLTIGFGEAFSMTRRFEMIANERVTHRLSPAAGLLVVALFGLACCYPAMAQSPDDEPSSAAGSDVTHSGDTKKADDVESEKLKFDIKFQWHLKHPATATFKFLDDDSGRGVFTIRAEQYPKDAQMELFKAMHQAKSLKFAKVTTEMGDQDKEKVTLILESEPMAASQMSAAILDVGKHFRLQRVSVFGSTLDGPTSAMIGDGNPAAATSDAATSDAVARDLREWFDSARSALPEEGDESGWKVELQGRHFYETKDQPTGDSAGQAALPLKPKSTPKTAPDVAGVVASETVRVNVLANDQSETSPFDLSTLEIVKAPAHGTARPQPDGTIEYVPEQGYTGKDKFQYAIADQSGNVTPATEVKIRVVNSGRENPLRFGDVNGDGLVTALDALTILNQLDAVGAKLIPVGEDDRGPDYTDVDGNRVIEMRDALLVINFLNDANGDQPRQFSLNGDWRLQRTIHGGVVHEASEQFKYYFWSFDADAKKLTTKWETSAIDGHTGVNRFVVNKTTAPKQLTVYGEEALLQAIYELDGDTLRIGMFGKSELQRPATFQASGSDETGPLVVFELKRHFGPLPE